MPRNLKQHQCQFWRNFCQSLCGDCPNTKRPNTMSAFQTQDISKILRWGYLWNKVLLSKQRMYVIQKTLQININASRHDKMTKMFCQLTIWCHKSLYPLMKMVWSFIYSFTRLLVFKKKLCRSFSTVVTAAFSEFGNCV